MEKVKTKARTMSWDDITPEDILRIEKETERFLHPECKTNKREEEMDKYEKWWHENKFQITLSNLISCNEKLGEIANEQEMAARAKLVEICEEVTRKATD